MIDLSKPEARPVKIVFFTDEDTGSWLNGLADDNGLEVSLVVHRITKKAREGAAPTDGERRQSERRAS